MNRLFVSLVTGLLVLPAVPASAASIVFSDEDAFAIATGAAVHPLPSGAKGSYLQAPTIVTNDSVLTFTAFGNDLFSNWAKYSGVSRLPGTELAVSGKEDFTIAASAARYAFGFLIYEPIDDTSVEGCNSACTESVFTITLLDGGAVVGSPFLFAPANDQKQFWGVHTSYAFNAVQISEAGGIDNELFAKFRTGSAALEEAEAMAAVPEPGSLLLFGAGLILIARHLRRRA